MAREPLGAVLHHLRCLTAAGAAECPEDGALLRAFVAGKDQEAFTALVERHGAMVLTVCRRVLRREQDAEDAFQATFLLLAGKAASLGRRESLAGWLHNVAYRMAANARRATLRRQRHEGRARAMPTVKPEAEVAWREVQDILHAEIQRLPAVYRDTFVRCCLESQSAPEAARALGIKEATVRSRLAKARSLLHKALARRGVSLSAVLAASALTTDAARAALSRGLIASTVRGAALIAAGSRSLTGTVPTSVEALLKGARMSQFVAQIKAGAMAVVVLTLAGIGVCLGTQPRATATAAGEAPAVFALPEPRRDDFPPPDRVADEVPDVGENRQGNGRVAAPDHDGPAVQPPGAGRGHPTAVVTSPSGEVTALPTVRGRILGPDGRPPASATIAVLYADHSLTGLSTNDGEFQVPAARLDLVGGQARATPVKPVGVAAAANGLGFGWTDAAALTAKAEPTVRLVEDLPIRGRLLDREGRPVASARVRVEEVRDYAGKDLKTVLRALTARGGGSVAASTWRVRPEWDSAVPGGYAAGRATASGADGRFELTGLGRGRVVRLEITARSARPVTVTVLTFGPVPGGPSLPDKDAAGHPVYRARFDHRLAAENR